MKVAGALMVVVAAVVLLVGQSAAMKHYAGKLPNNVDVQRYLEICRVCGQFYGGAMERSCLMDKTFETFDGCEAAILNRK